MLSSHDDVHHAFRSRSLRQALYDEGGVVMADCLLTLHGDAHRTRRRLENRLFRREMFTRWEREELGATIDTTLTPAIAAGEGDLIPLGYRITMNLTALVAGIDCPIGSTEETDHLYTFVRTFSEGATLVHSTRDHAVVRAEVKEALEQFDRAFLEPSIRRRQSALEAARADPSAHGLVPRDVLNTLLQYSDDLTLTPEIIRREVAFYLQAGSHSTANAFTHTADELFAWIASHPKPGRALTDRAGADRFLAVKINFQHFFALHIRAFYVLQSGDDLARGGLDHIAGRGIRVAAIHAECDPPRLVAQPDVGDLPRRHHRGVEDVQTAVESVRQPDFLFVWRQADAVAGATVAFGRAGAEARHFDAVKHFPGGEIADFKSQQFVHIHETES